MNLIVDTHVLLWLWTDSLELSETAKKIYLDPQARLFVSIASVWEICIKKSLGKIVLKENWWKNLNHFVDDNGIQWLQIKPDHCHQVSSLPFHHRDPFDRMIVAQALAEDLAILTRDQNMKLYGPRCFW